ncbi:FAD-binding oxidoreductase [Novosphingobium sp.]|uniref:FAD-binding oxidoreductase n=1 Tax=Novosphingobium sp. TaxID=1874826 RepID=UPI0025CE88F5|nr:FAD-binding oxidoreductase [Novosphingobium sp.]
MTETGTPPLLDELSAILGPRGLDRDPDTVGPWLTDWRGRYTGRALGLAAPASTDELARVVKACRRAGVPIVPQGGNSGMSGGATPDTSGSALLLTTRRMNAIRSIDAETRQAVCEAGVVLQSLHDAAANKALRFPLTLGGKGSATIGGLISTNAGGTQVLRHGVMRAQVLGLEAVLPDGQVFNALTPLRKDNRGFDLKQLFIGSEGTLGIVTAATLRLVPALADRVVVWAGLRSIHDARSLLLYCEAVLGDAVEGFEVLPRVCLQSVLAYLPDARSPLTGEHPWHALIEVVADSSSAAETLRDRVEQALAAAFEQGLVEDAVLSASEAQAETFWTLRDSISPAERARGPAMQHDISVPVARMPAFIEEAGAEVEAAWPGTEVMGFGHLGDGNIHFHVAAPHGTERAAWEAGDGKAINRMVHDLVTAWGGSISAEHGIGQSKRDELARLYDPVALDLMRRIKAALDPAEGLNPGKLVTLAPAASKA